MNYSNNAYSVLDGSITAAATTIQIAAGTGSRFPASDFQVTLVGYDVNGNESAWEIAHCSSRSGDVLTVTRGQEGTSAAAWASGARIENRITAGSMAALEPTITPGTTAQYLRGDKGWRDFFTDVRAATLTGLSTATNSPVVSTDTVLQAVGKLQAQVGSAGVGLRNKIINGKMEIAQRGTSFAAIGNTYSLDRWMRFSNATEVVTISQQADAPPGDEFQRSLRVAVTTADSSIAAGDASSVYQLIEGYNARDLIGRTLTLSFWVRSSKVGVHCVSLGNSGLDRSYVSEYTISTANTWERKTVTIPGGLITAGTWDWGAGIGLRVVFTLAAGSSLQTTAGAWQTSNFVATANQVNCLDTVGNIFAITGVELKASSGDTTFEHRPYGLELALCQRYYYRDFPGATSRLMNATGAAFSSTLAMLTTALPVPMRTAPSALEQSGTASQYSLNIPGVGNVACSSVPVFVDGNKSLVRTQFQVASGLTTNLRTDAFTSASGGASAYLGWSAEL